MKIGKQLFGTKFRPRPIWCFPDITFSIQLLNWLDTQQPESWAGTSETKVLRPTKNFFISVKSLIIATLLARTRQKTLIVHKICTNTVDSG